MTTVQLLRGCIPIIVRCLLFIARWVSFLTSHSPFFCCLPCSVGRSIVQPSAKLMPMSLCEFGKIELEGAYVCKPNGCSEIRFCCLPWSVGRSPVESSAEQMSMSPSEVGKFELEGRYVCNSKGYSEIRFCCMREV